jgi:excisionase family DNA binding protein
MHTHELREVWPLASQPSGISGRHFEPLLNDEEAANFLGGLHRKTVQRMARRGELPAYRIGKLLALSSQ